MKRAIIALILGLAIGYQMGFADGGAGRPALARRVLERFGVSKVRDAQRARERQTETIKP